MSIPNSYVFCPGDTCIRFLDDGRVYDTYLLLEHNNHNDWKVLQLSDNKILGLSRLYCKTYWFLLDDPMVVEYLTQSFPKEEK